MAMRTIAMETARMYILHKIYATASREASIDRDKKTKI